MRTFIAESVLAALLAFASDHASAAQHHSPPHLGNSSDFAVTYQINPAHNGAIDLSTGFTVPLEQAWSKDLVYALDYPIIADGQVFVHSGGTYLFGLDVTNGHSTWHNNKLDGGGLGLQGMAYDNGSLFILNSDGLLLSFATADGKKNWSTSLPLQYMFNAPVMAVNGQVFIGGTGVGGDLYAVDESNGKLQWVKPVDGGDFSSPAYGDKGIYVAYPCRYYKFKPSNGKVLWEIAGNDTGGGGATPVYFGKRVLIQDDTPTCGADTVRNTRNGNETGTFVSETTPAVFQTSKGKDLVCGVFLYDNPKIMQCTDLKTGALVWSFTGDGRLVTPPIVVNGLVVVGSLLGELYVVDENGKEVWSTLTPGPVTHIAAGLGTLIVISTSKVTAYVPQ